jgi:hypothetical protein
VAHWRCPCPYPASTRPNCSFVPPGDGPEDVGDRGRTCSAVPTFRRMLRPSRRPSRRRPCLAPFGLVHQLGADEINLGALLWLVVHCRMVRAISILTTGALPPSAPWWRPGAVSALKDSRAVEMRASCASPCARVFRKLPDVLYAGKGRPLRSYMQLADRWTWEPRAAARCLRWVWDPSHGGCGSDEGEKSGRRIDLRPPLMGNAAS